MTFGDKLKQARVERKLKQSDLAKQLKVTNTTISNWENNVSKPDLDMLSYICGVLNVKVSYFLDPQLPDDDVTIPELNLIKKYRLLDSYGRETVNIALNRELDRTKQFQAVSRPSASPQLRIYTYMHRIACAGTGFYFDDIPTATMEAPYMDGADFIIGVNGDSMEPEYHDGDNLYVKKTSDLSIGDIGIFTIRNECYLKKLGEDGLISLNPQYRNIPGNEDMRLIGKVIGKVE